MVLLTMLFYFTSIFSRFSHDPLQGAEERIQKYRMAKASIKILDKKGVPVPYAKVLIAQVKHEFIFGSTVYSYVLIPEPEEKQKYFQLFSKLFNLAVVPFFWRHYEPEPGMTREEETKELIHLFQQAGIRVFGHPLIDANIPSNPPWLKKSDELENRIKARVEREVGNFPEIQGWVVMNEPTIGWAPFPTGAWIINKGPLTATRLSLDWAHKKNPDAILLVNNFLTNPFLDLYSVFYHLGAIPGLIFSRKVKKPISYLDLLTALSKENTPDFGIGIQSHMYSFYWPLWMTDEIITRYGKLGKPLYFTEISVPSGEFRIINWSREFQTLNWSSLPERETLQAEYVEKFYTLLFSRPEVEGIIWFDFSDREAHLGAPVGLLRKDLSPKPAYDTLYHLIKEKWWTRLEAQTDQDGKLQFSGFYGVYQITVKSLENNTQSFEINLNKIGPREFTLQMN